MTALAKNPLFLDTLIIDEVIAFYRDAIKRHRAQLLALVSLVSHKCVSGFGLFPIPYHSFQKSTMLLLLTAGGRMMMNRTAQTCP